MSFAVPVTVGFQHCDPAGIVFYPRYAEWTNWAAESFFAGRLGRSYAAIMAAGQGCPTVTLDLQFRAPSRLGDALVLTLRVVAVGRSSLELAIEGRAPGEAAPRFTATKRMVWMAGGRPAAWPDDLRAALERERTDEP